MSEDSKEQLVVKGSTLKGIVRRRIIVPPTGQAFHRAVDTQETIIKQFVNNNAVTPYGSFTYMQDWDLGDIVTVMDRKWGVTLNTRVIEVKEIYEVNGFNLECTFGNSIPTIIDSRNRIGKQSIK